jgi:hypothetical protein
MVVNDALRREAGSLEMAETMSAAEMLRAMALYRQMAAGPQPSIEELQAAHAAVEPEPEPVEREAPPTADATVTPLESARKRGEGPARA